MPYIGNISTTNFSSITKDTFSGNGSATAFTLSKPSTTNGVAVYVENVRQIPTTAYTVSGTTLDFGSGNAPVSGTNNIYVMHHNTPVSTATHPSTQVLEATSGAFTAKSSVDISSSGNAIDFKLGGTTIGNVGVISDRVYLTAEGSHGVYLDASANNFCPSSTTGTDNNGNIDLGASFAKWKDVHLAGNVVVGTAGKGIDFSATGDGTGSMSSEILDDYEEGTWTASLISGTGITFSSSERNYVKIGRVVYINIQCSFSGTSSVRPEISGLPFASSDTSAFTIFHSGGDLPKGSAFLAQTHSGHNRLSGGKSASDLTFSEVNGCNMRITGCYLATA